SARSPRPRTTATAARSCSPAPAARSAPGRICTSAWTRTAKPSCSEARSTPINPLVRKLRALPFPVIAAVNGVAAVAGANIALASDIVLAARSASFVQAFAKIGLIPDCGGTWLLPRLIGPARARALALTDDPLAADKAETWGLIWKALDDGELMAQ